MYVELTLVEFQLMGAIAGFDNCLFQFLEGFDGLEPDTDYKFFKLCGTRFVCRSSHDRNSFLLLCVLVFKNDTDELCGTRLPLRPMYITTGQSMRVLLTTNY